jgi:hypothetical protein
VLNTIHGMSPLGKDVISEFRETLLSSGAMADKIMNK